MRLPAPRWTGIAAGMLLLSACMPESSIKPVQDLAAVGPEQVLLVGRVELHPALKPGEQKLGDSYKEYADEALLVVDDELRPVEEFERGDLKQRIDAPFDRTFLVQAPAKPFFILKGWVVMDAEVRVMGPNERPPEPAAPLEGAFKVDVHPGDRAVYIGTIQYFRDEFFSTVKVVVKDDYAAANAEFQRKFGKGVTLRKALAVPAAD
jgi:hypothetical protein